MNTDTFNPRLHRYLGKELTTSANSPDLAKGAISGETNPIFTICSSENNNIPSPLESQIYFIYFKTKEFRQISNRFHRSRARNHILIAISLRIHQGHIASGSSPAEFFFKKIKIISFRGRDEREMVIAFLDNNAFIFFHQTAALSIECNVHLFLAC